MRIDEARWDMNNGSRRVNSFVMLERKNGILFTVFSPKFYCSDSLSDDLRLRGWKFEQKTRVCRQSIIKAITRLVKQTGAPHVPRPHEEIADAAREAHMHSRLNEP